MRVLVGGAFQILHPGHIFFLKKAKELGDELFVILAKDSTLEKINKEVIVPENQRLKMIKELKIVDQAFIGYDEDCSKIINEIDPDIIVFGFDQEDCAKKVEKYVRSNNLNIKLVKLNEFSENDLHGTSKIIKRVLSG